MFVKDLIKQKYIKEYIHLYKRSPTQQEIKAHIVDYLFQNKESKDNGFVAGTKINFQNKPGNESSAKNYNELIHNLISEQEALKNFYYSEIEKLENTFRSFKNIFNRVYLNLKATERNLNMQLLLHEKRDIYSYGVVEDFSSYENIDFNNSDIHLLNGKVTLGYSSLTNEDIKDSEISYSIRNRSNELIQQENLNNISNALKEDGSFFKVVGRSSQKESLMDFTVEIKLTKPKNVDVLKFVTDSIETTSKMSHRCFYTVDGEKYIEVFESAIRTANGTNYIEINQKDVKQIKLVLTKQSYDYRSGNYYDYLFSLDYIGLTSKSFKINKKSTLLLGPYEIKDENENPINYNFATIRYGTCCIVPELSSVKFFISKNNTDWIPVSYTGEGREVVQFSESKANIDALLESVDSTTTNKIIRSNSPFELKETEALLNYKISESNYNSLIKNTLRIKRNILDKSKSYINDSYPGWNKEGNFYSTVIEVNSPEGKFINFGNSFAFLNERQVTGKVFLPFGKHTFKTSKSNYFNILEATIDTSEEAILNARELKQIDPLYPKNHKYLIEGFNYNTNFAGKKVYSKIGEVYSQELIQVSKERFNIKEDENLYCIVKYEGYYYFKIKIKSNYGDSKLEKISIECNKESSVNSNLLYIKAILETTDSKVTPKIDQVQVRVI